MNTRKPTDKARREALITGRPIRPQSSLPSIQPGYQNLLARLEHAGRSALSWKGGTA